MIRLFQVLLLFSFHVFYGQMEDKIEEPVELVSSRSIYLQSGIGSSIGGSSRSYVRVDLPTNTVKWYYSFTTSVYKRKLSNINLTSQLIGIYTDNDSLKENLQSKIEVPDGSCGIDIYALNERNVNLFIEKRNYTHYIEGTVKNTEQAVVEVGEIRENVVYLGLKNPGRFLGVHIRIEVVAITESIIESKKSHFQLKSELLGHSGRDEYDRGKYLKCIEYCEESTQIFPLGWVKANKGLAALQLNRTNEALHLFFDAIILINDQANSQQVFSGLLRDLEKIQKEHPSLAEVSKVKKMIEMQMD